MGLKAVDISNWISTLESKAQGDTNICKCPNHKDKSPSFAFKEDSLSTFGISFKCFAGCDDDKLIDKLKRIGLLINDNEKSKIHKIYIPVPPKFNDYEYKTHYKYTDKDGELLFYVARFEKDVYEEKEGNTIRTTKKQVIPFAITPNKEGQWWKAGLGDYLKKIRPIYNMKKVVNTLEIWIVEGEKTVDSLSKIGIVATCCVGGSSAAKKADWSCLIGKDVIIWSDRDDPGQKYQNDVINCLKDLSIRYRIVNTAKVKI